MKPFDFIITQNLTDPLHRESSLFDDQTLELARSLARGGFRTLLIRMSDHPEFEEIRFEDRETTVESSESWASFAQLDIKSPSWAIGHLRPFAHALAFKKSLEKYSKRLSTIIATGYEGAFFRKLKNKKRLVYWQAPDKKWPSPVEKDWTKVGEWLETLIWEPERVALAMTIHSSFEVVASVTNQLHLLQANFYVPAPRGQIALPVINPRLDQSLVYEPQGQQSILFMGEDPMSGGLDTLLEAWNNQEPEWKRAHPLMVVSRIEEGTNLWKWVEGLMPHGLEYIPIDDLDHLAINELILQSRLVCLPSRVEETSGFQLWTIALGANLLTTMVGANPDVIGQEAVLVEPGDREGLTKALPRALIEVPEDRLYERRRQFSWDTFNSQMRANRFAELFQAPEKIAGAIFEDPSESKTADVSEK